MYLRDDIGRRTTLFSTTGKRHDAVSAELVAAFDDRNKSYVLRSPSSCRDVPLLTVGAFAGVDDPAFAIEGAIHQFGQPVGSAGPDNEIYRRAVIEKRLPFQLRHTTHDSDQRFTAQTRPANFA